MGIATNAMSRPRTESSPHSAQTPPRAHVGCSGWAYDDWRGIIYPEQLPKRAWFDHYSTLFDTVELNTTFYRMPTIAVVDRWAHQAPAGFVYSLKLGMFGSHRMKLRDAASWLPNHVDRANRLGSALGPTVVQLPPRWKCNVERLDEFLTVAPRELRWAIELRDSSWLNDDVFALLERHGAALCLHDLLENHPWVRTTDWVYARFHGPSALQEKYRGRYGPRRLSNAAESFNRWLADGCDVYAYFNNDYDGHAVADALWLAKSLSAPPTDA